MKSSTISGGSSSPSNMLVGKGRDLNAILCKKKISELIQLMYSGTSYV